MRFSTNVHGQLFYPDELARLYGAMSMLNRFFTDRTILSKAD